ncbi:ROK family protein [Pyxidicoccus parkwayensis]|uniref:ROK family protein n=1 Tax=Pyxidicoccus parkwayensis TaxID=2813578 RepID=A0ABX7NQE0_9BACT|nr:ROK family protein [Pyxidicoccus parkwaysis]QSQ21072.1 ROK family protein [Pyxidicoccus parkwaysis]
MSHATSGWSARRYVPEGVSSLEVWNHPVLGRELWELLGTERVERDRRAGVPESMLAFHLLPVLAGALADLVTEHDADAVWICGGLTCLEGFTELVEEATAGLPFPVYVAEDPRYAPVHAGLRLLEPLRPRRPVALDVGQTSIKCASPGAQRIFERDTGVVPFLHIGTPRPEDGRHVRAAVRFIGDALRAFVEQGEAVPANTRSDAAIPSNTPSTSAQTGAGTPGALCLALPCPLDAALVPGGCTYGWEGHAPLVTDILRAAGLSGGGAVLVLNDAELAAEAARGDPRLEDSRRVLCLTLGFGPGGALLMRG